jgi:hypothetical protein
MIFSTTCINIFEIASKRIRGASDEPEAIFRFELKELIADFFSEGSSVQLAGLQLIIHQLPRRFTQRYGDISETIFVRECYRELYKTVSRSIIDEMKSSSLTRFAGVPGIGKSMFLLYFIYRFLADDRFPDKSFAVELINGEYLTFEGTADATKFICHSESGDGVISKKSLLLCDVADGLEPVSRAKKTFIFTSSTSPPPKHFYEILNGSPNFRYTMPTWSEQEFMFAEADVSQWYDNFVHYGGVPRLVFSKLANASSLLLQEALIESGEAIVECLFKYGYEYEGSNLVIHCLISTSKIVL